MAVTKIHSIKATVGRAIKYVTNPDKTNEYVLVDYLNCSQASAEWSFRNELKIADRFGHKNKTENGNQAFHLIQSFKPEETTPEEAHKVGMELVNELYRYKELDDVNMGLMRAAAETTVLLLSPFVPHICEEMWEGLGYTESLYRHPWPECDETALVKDTEEIVIQVNGKVRDRMEVPSGLSRDDIAAYCKDTAAVKKLTEGKEVVKMIAVPGKLFNIVVKG